MTNKRGINLKKTIMRNILYIIVLLLITATALGQRARTFPYSISFTEREGVIPADVSVSLGRGSVARTEEDIFTTKGLLLARDGAGHDFAAVALDEVKLPSVFGLHVEFDYTMYASGSSFGDGLVFFIYDANEQFEVGAPGSGLGYGPTIPTTTNQSDYDDYFHLGLSGAYLGIGFDAYSLFKNRIRSSFESREGIPRAQDNNFEQQKDFITVRAGAYVDSNGNYNLEKGYPVLYSQVFSNNININSNYSTSAKLNYSNGQYSFVKKNNSVDFPMRPQSPNSENLVFYRVFLDLIPKVVNNETSMLITLKVEHPNGTTTILEDFEYSNNFKTYDFYENMYDFKNSIPRLFSIGFSASNGQFTQTQIVKDVYVSLPYFPETEEDIVEDCLSTNSFTNARIEINFSPFDNDSFYTGPVADPSQGNSSYYIDYSSFQFEDSNGNAMPQTTSGNIITYNQSGVGSWTYDKGTGKVKLILGNNTNIRPGVDAQVYYSVKGNGNGGPFNDENYRSEPTKIKFVAKECHSRLNPQLPIRPNN